MPLAPVIGFLGRSGAALSAIALFAMMAVGITDIVAAKLLNRPLPGALELTEALMVVCIFLALSGGQRHQTHIRMTFLIRYLPAKPRMALDFVAHALTAFFLLLITWQGAKQGLSSFTIREYAAGLISFPLYPAKLALALGAGLMLLQTLLDLVQSAIGLLTGFRERAFRS